MIPRVNGGEAKRLVGPWPTWLEAVVTEASFEKSLVTGHLGSPLGAE
jgi:hypothetical protein